MKTLNTMAREFSITVRAKFWKLFLRALRSVTLVVDDWIQREETKLREPAEKRAAQAEVNPIQSRQREKVIRAVRPKLARLRYQHGEFVRS